MNDDSFAVRLLRAKSKASWSQAELARRVGVPRATVCRWEAEKSYPAYETLIKLAQTLNVSTDYLCGLKEPE